MELFYFLAEEPSWEETTGAGTTPRATTELWAETPRSNGEPPDSGETILWTDQGHLRHVHQSRSCSLCHIVILHTDSKKPKMDTRLFFPTSLTLITCISLGGAKQNSWTICRRTKEGETRRGSKGPSNNGLRMSCVRTEVSWPGSEPTLCWSKTPGLELCVLMHSAMAWWPMN